MAGLDIDLEVDGGIDQDNARRAIEAGADVLVAGTATFRGGPGRLCRQYQGAARMSLLGRVESETGESEIEPGKRLIRVGDDRGLSLFERIGYRLHRFAWRTPLHALRLRGRVPLKLVAVPKDPIVGDKAAGEALLARHRPPRRHRDRRSTASISARSGCPRISATICRASPGCATFPPPPPASAAPTGPKR